MIITLIAQERISTISLPTRIGGRYWISLRNLDNVAENVADVEGVQNQWLLHSSSFLSLLNEHNQEVSTIVLDTDKQVIGAKIRNTAQPIQFYVEPSSQDRQIFRRYFVRENCRLNIGRAADNQIVFENKYVSQHHACLIWKNQEWSITDTQSRNGTFVNEERIATRRLNPGDTAYIMGLKIIVGNGFFALNNPDQGVSINADFVAELAQQPVDEANQEYMDDPTPELFLSSPRIRRNIEKPSINVDSPPPMPNVDEAPLALLLGPALTMGLTAVVMGSVAIINLQNGTSTLLTALPTIVMSFSMLCGTLLWPLLTKRSEKKKRAVLEAARQKKYREYLDTVRNELFKTGEVQKEILFENYPSIKECERRVIERDRTLWERTVRQDDFLRLRLGVGNVPLDANIKFPDKKFSMDEDPLQNDVQRLADEPRILKDAPITCSLIKNPVIGISGNKQETCAFLQSLILQIASLHGYDEVKLVFFLDKSMQSEWESFRLLPHTLDETANIRYFAVDSDDEKAISLHLERILADRVEQTGARLKNVSPHYVLIAVNRVAAQRIELLSKIGSEPNDYGFSALTVATQTEDLPKECSMVIELGKDSSSLYDRNDFAGKQTAFQEEITNQERSDQICGILGNLMMHSEATQYAFPSLITFLEMYDVGKTEHLNVLTRWKENSPVNTLQAPVGVGQDGARFNLDLHERAHGPHGLIAGMTGSGKSEFIITFILSMAVNYHPNEVSFILIDYKGGGLAGAFEDTPSGVRLPHLAGTITNLDGAAVNRALTSIQSELRRRQAVFNCAKQVSGEGTMDIYKYQKMYRSGAVSDPIPHLFIVSDEFAELKAQQPEFMTQLISTARIGRSLGVHLILATQKPTGVVDDQIWSNSRFRVCLKVQERADSVEMLKRPDAAELKDTGRFYLQVGYNELFELGQSAWCGAPYIPTNRLEKKRNNSITVIDHVGRVRLERRQKSQMAESSTSQVVSVVRHLYDLAETEHAFARRLWLPPIPEFIFLDDLVEKYHWHVDPFELNPIIGEFDDPFNQSQGLLTIPFSQEGNALVYGVAGGGKTTLLNTLMVGLIRNYSPEQLNIYIVDMGEETLRVFAEAPQVGDVLLSTDGEKIMSLFKMLQDEIRDRKKLFSEGDGSYSSYCRATGAAIPQILVLIRNYAAFAEQLETLNDRLIQITRDCSKYGIYFLMTANAANTIRYRITQNFAKMYALQLNDNSDYIGIFGGTNGVYPSKIKGRGIYKTDRVYEFQSAHFAREADQVALRVMVSEIAARTTAKAKPVPTLPERIVPSLFQDPFTATAVPIGIEKDSLHICTWDISKSVISIVLAQDTNELGKTVQGICEQISRLPGSVTVIDGADLLDESSDFSYYYLKCGFAERLSILFQEMVRRNNTYKTAVADGEPPENYAPEYYIITGFQAILNTLDSRGQDELNTLLEKAEPHYNIRFLLCDGAKTMSGLTSSAWYKRQVKNTEGIWVGDGIANQYALAIGKMTSELYSEVPPHFGYTVKRGKATLVKFIVGERCEEEVSG